MTRFNGLETIVLVDDDAATNYINTLIIKNAEIEAEIHVMQTAEKALHSIATDEVKPKGGTGMILLDINMPIMNGWEFMEEFEKLSDEQKSKYIVVMLSSSLNHEDIARAKENKNIAAFLHKPLEPKELSGLVKKLFA
jgi:CheY-like chemotaxis protein